jgi:hypothetical protein
MAISPDATRSACWRMWPKNAFILANAAGLQIDRHGKDQYGRTLALIRIRGADVGEMLIQGACRRTMGRPTP